MNERLQNRLANWKFRQAVMYLKGEPPEVQDTVKALARLYGNCGWPEDGDLAELVKAALRGIGFHDSV